MSFRQRVWGVLRLDAFTFEEIEADRTATVQAMIVVIAASLAAGIGGAAGDPVALVRETVAALAGWVMWAGLTYVIGTRILPEPQTRTHIGELLRLIGFSYAPNLFAVFALIRVIDDLVRGLVALWLLAATVVAVRQALDYRSTLRALAVVLIGWAVFVLITAIL